LRKKAYKNFCFCESSRENFPFGMRIRIQELTECVSGSETLVDDTVPKTHLKNFAFDGRLREHKNICKNFCENKNFHENEHFRENFLESKIFAKSENDSAPCDFDSATLTCC
jgi:hypothetical protein